MSTDAELIRWLRRTPLYDGTGDSIDARADEAADRLVALIAERDKLKDACAGIADDYMTSDNHHPNHVLIPVERFEAIRAALSPIQEDLVQPAAVLADGQCDHPVVGGVIEEHRSWCGTCGRYRNNPGEHDCENCEKWWADNPPPDCPVSEDGA